MIGETIGANFDRIAASYPQQDAVVVRHQDVRWTYAEFAERVDRVARALIAIGCGLEIGSGYGRLIAPSDCWSSTRQPRPG